MLYTASYPSPLGEITLAADGQGLTGLWFAGQKRFGAGLSPDAAVRELPVFDEARAWLDAYFARRDPGPVPSLHLMGTDFQRAVWVLLTAIPYGETTTYGALARALAAQAGLPSMSAQAVGGAVGRNPVSILVPCHRVVGADGRLTGYAGGLDRKRRLLTLEGADAGCAPAPQGAVSRKGSV